MSSSRILLGSYVLDVFSHRLHKCSVDLQWISLSSQTQAHAVTSVKKEVWTSIIMQSFWSVGGQIALSLHNDAFMDHQRD
uniref:Uncharacterized protein n=1 Tax=Knipowitschia caucasica TaxID=637954 RepID=A0AAV2MGW9_KNICA